VGLRHFYRVAALIILGLMVTVSASACAAPQYNYVADSSDSAYFKVPPSWHQVSQNSLQSAVASPSALGSSLWDRAYDASAEPSVRHVFSSTPEPAVFAWVVSLSSSERSSISLDAMRDLFLPVTSGARQTASAQGQELPGFQSISDQVLTNGSGYRGIREIFDYTLNGVPETFDQTVMTNSDTTKLYVLLVQCYTSTFATDYSQISQVVNSFTVGG
jgi:hypothetical protein